jgi:hypothetical protein
MCIRINLRAVALQNPLCRSGQVPVCDDGARCAAPGGAACPAQELNVMPTGLYVSGLFFGFAEKQA